MTRYFNPEQTDSRRDYKTNAPTYYDYLAQQQETLKSQEDEIQELLSEDLTKSVKVTGNATITDTNSLDSRHEYVIDVPHDDTKANKVESSDNTITVTDGETTDIKANPNKVILSDNLLGLDGIAKTTVAGVTTLKADYNKIQKKMQAGENIILKDDGTVICAVGDANIKSKENKFRHFLEAGRMMGTFKTLPAQAVVTSASPDELVISGTYFCDPAESTFTPNGGRGWLEVISTPTYEACLQKFYRELGSDVYVRAGSSVNIDDGKEFWGRWKVVHMTDAENDAWWKIGDTTLSFGSKAVNVQGKYSRYKNYSSDYSTTYEFRDQEGNHKRSKFLKRFSDVSYVFQSIAFKPYSRVMYQLYSAEQTTDGSWKSPVVVHDGITGQAVREGYAPDFDHASDSVFIGDDLWVVGNYGKIVRWNEVTDSTTTFTPEFCNTDPNEHGCRNRNTGISWDRENPDNIYILINQETLNDEGNKVIYNSYDRQMIYLWHPSDGSYQKVLDIKKEGFYNAGLEYFKGKFYLLNQRTSTDSSVMTGIRLDVYDAATTKRINYFEMEGELEPEGITLYNDPVCASRYSTDSRYKDGRILRWDTYIAIGVWQQGKEAFVTSIAPEYTDGINDGIGTRYQGWDKTVTEI